MALTQIKTDAISDDAVTLAKQAAGTDGQIITYDASGNPTAVGPGTDGQVLTSTGAGSPPAFEAIPAGVGGATGVDFNDDVKATFGDGEDLKIYHNGTDNYIMPSNGKLIINNGSETLASFTSNGAVELFYDNVLKFKTVSGGVRTAGNLELLDDHVIQLGSGIDFQIHHKSADNGNYIECENGRTLYYQSDLHAILDEAGNEYIIKGTANGAVELYYDNSKKLETISTGVNITGGVRLGGNNADNELDDYEEGFYTPSVGAYNSNGTIAYQADSRWGRYRKVGSLCHVAFDMNISSWSSGAGTLRVELPFAQADWASSGQYYYSSPTWWAVDPNFAGSNGNYRTGYIDSNSSWIYPYTYPNDGGNLNSWSNNNTGRISGCITYITG